MLLADPSKGVRGGVWNAERETHPLGENEMRSEKSISLLTHLLQAEETCMCR